MLIGQLANVTDLTVDTIRFYERAGLLNRQHFTRQPNNYRHYNPAAVDRLKLIRLGQMLGFSLAEMREMIEPWEQNQISTEEKIGFFEDNIAKANRQIEELEAMKAFLNEKIEYVRSGEPMEPEPA